MRFSRVRTRVPFVLAVPSAVCLLVVNVRAVAQPPLMTPAERQPKPIELMLDLGAAPASPEANGYRLAIAHFSLKQFDEARAIFEVLDKLPPSELYDEKPKKPAATGRASSRNTFSPRNYPKIMMTMNVASQARYLARSLNQPGRYSSSYAKVVDKSRDALGSCS